MKNIFSKIALALAAFGLLSTACSKDFLETMPTSSVPESQIFQSTEASYLAVNGIHRLMHEGGTSGSTTNWDSQGGYPTFCLHLAAMTDDYVFTYNNTMFPSSVQWAMHRDFTHKYQNVNYYWKFFYRIINNANKILSYIDNIPGSETYRNSVKGQALAYRAFAHFQLVQAWAERYDWTKKGNNSQLGVILRTDVSADPKARSSVEDVYKQINTDLDSAIFYLDKPCAEKLNKSHIDKWVARGLKARVLLTQGEWKAAADMAVEVINGSGATFDPTTFTDTDKENRNGNYTNKEWLWALCSSKEGDFAQHDKLKTWHDFISNNATSYARKSPRAIYNLLYQSIPETDARKIFWVENPYDNYFTYNNGMGVKITDAGMLAPWMSQKWLVSDPVTTHVEEDVAYMRIPEMYLIAAEGYARAKDEPNAKKYLYSLASNRNPSYPEITTTGDALLREISWQRRVELWAECGLRWFDLKRKDEPVDRGPKPRADYNQGGTANGWVVKGLKDKSKTDPTRIPAAKMPTNLDPLASNYNMYGEKTPGEDARYIEKPSLNKKWQWLIPTQEFDSNPLCVQND